MKINRQGDDRNPPVLTLRSFLFSLLFTSVSYTPEKERTEYFLIRLDQINFSKRLYQQNKGW